MEKVNVQILDGGLGAMLASKGHEELNYDEMWGSSLILSAPDDVLKAHKEFLSAGSDIIGSITYQASVEGFCKFKHMSVQEAETAVIDGNQLAVRARDSFWEKRNNREGRVQPQVAASCGPYGVLLHDGSEYTGSYMSSTDLQKIHDFHHSNVQLASASEVDYVSFDTIPSVLEADVIIGVLREHPNIKAFLSFSCKDESSTCAGESITSAFSQKLASCDQIVAYGINCTPPWLIETLLHTGCSGAAINKPLMVRPNSGASWNAVRRRYESDGETDLASFVSLWSPYGVRMWGGCCNIFPEHIAKLRASLLTVTADTS